MATPGYPQQPPMGGPPMGGPPMAMQQRPRRRGTSKAVPIVMSAGLAVGVFCGLLFGVGKKSEAVAAAPAKTEEKVEAKEASPPPAQPTPPPTTPEPAAGSATEVAAAAPTETVPAAAPEPTIPPATGSATPAAAEVPTTKIVVVIKTEAAAQDAKLIIDGKAVDGLTAEIPSDKKTAKVEVKSSGFRSYEKKLDLTPGELTLEIEMAKRPAGGTTPSVRPPKRPDKPPSGGGGLIDI